MRKVRNSALGGGATFPILSLTAAALIQSGTAFAQAEEAPAEEKPAAPAEEAPKEDVPAPTESDTKEGGEEASSDTDSGQAPATAEGEAAAEAPEGTTAPETDAPEQPASSEPAPSEPAPAEPVSPPVGAGVSTGAGAESSFGAFPNPAEDQKALEKQGDERPEDVEPDQVFAEDWWSHTRPTVELHGNFRVRSSIYHNFSLQRQDTPNNSIWPRPADDYYTTDNGDFGAEACTPDEAKSGSSDSPDQATVGCVSRTQGGANMRFRLEPSIVISDNLRIRSQVDLLGNMVMGSTAQGNSNFPAASGGYFVGERGGYTPVSALSNTQGSPVSGINSTRDAIQVNRAWAEYETPVGELKFGRMPDHWGLGILRNAGDDIDGDYQSTVDRIAFFTGLPSASLYAGGAWDFTHEGATSAGFTPPGGQPYDLSQRDDLSRMNLMLFRRMDPQLEELELKKGKVIINGGLYLSYQWQRLDNELTGPSATCDTGAATLGCDADSAASSADEVPVYVRRGFKMWSPDLYLELKYKKFYFGAEAVTHQGKFDNLPNGPYVNPNGETDGWRINQWAFATEIEQRLVEDRLTLGFYSGWASGDKDVETLIPSNDIADQIGDRTISTFRFHPGYRVDLILNRHLLSRVQGSYYFKPMAQYDFIRKANGMKLGGRAEAIWTRASNFLQTPGHHRDLGIELNGSVYYQSSDGVLNDRQDLKGGFYSMLQYGVLFPLSGLGYEDGVQPDDFKLKAAQIVRAFLGVAF